MDIRKQKIVFIDTINLTEEEKNNDSFSYALVRKDPKTGLLYIKDFGPSIQALEGNFQSLRSSVNGNSQLIQGLDSRIKTLEEQDLSSLLKAINSKVSQTAFDALVIRVSNTESALESLSSLSADLELLQERVTRHTGEITDLGKLAPRVETLEGLTVAELPIKNNITKQELYNALINLFGTAATLDTGVSHGRIPTIGEDGKLPKSIMPISDGLIPGGTIERNKSDTEAIITPSDDFLAKYPDEVPGVNITITTETTKYSSVYFVVKNASNVTILGQENCEVGDWIIAQGVNGFDKIDNVDAVKSVNGMLGNVVIKPKDLILENYTTSELDDNNIYPTDSAQTGLSKLDKRVKELQESTAKKAPDVIFEIRSFETLTATEKALIVEKVKSITNNFNTDLVYESFNDIKLRHTSDETGPTISKTFSLVGYEYIEANKFYYKFTFNLNENTEFILTVVDTEEVTIETIKFAKEEDINKQIGDINTILATLVEVE